MTPFGEHTPFVVFYLSSKCKHLGPHMAQYLGRYFTLKPQSSAYLEYKERNHGISTFGLNMEKNGNIPLNNVSLTKHCYGSE